MAACPRLSCCMEGRPSLCISGIASRRNGDIDTDRLYRTAPFLRGSQITQQEPNTLTCLVDRGGPIKVSFFGLPHLARIRPPVVAEGNDLRVASLLDIAG